MELLFSGVPCVELNSVCNIVCWSAMFSCPSADHTGQMDRQLKYVDSSWSHQYIVHPKCNMPRQAEILPRARTSKIVKLSSVACSIADCFPYQIGTQDRQKSFSVDLDFPKFQLLAWNNAKELGALLFRWQGFETVCDPGNNFSLYFVLWNTGSELLCSSIHARASCLITLHQSFESDLGVTTRDARESKDFTADVDIERRAKFQHIPEASLVTLVYIRIPEDAGLTSCLPMDGCI